ncbi:MAG: hypothetical protein ABR567_07690 [Myxococcales bacterium]
MRTELLARGAAFELHDDHARIDGSWDLSLLPIAQACPSGAQPCVRAELERRFTEEKLGRELDAVRGDFVRARPALKLRVQRGPAAISAPIAGDLHAALVLDLPSFVTPVRPADLAAWEKPAEQLVAIALENVRAQEQVEVNPMEIAGTRIYAVSGKSLFVATLGLAADELVGKPTELGTLIAMPSAHILLCHAIADRRSLKALEAMAAGALQAFEGGPSPLSPDLFWKRGDHFTALPVRREDGEVKCEIPKVFDDEVASKLG